MRRIARPLSAFLLALALAPATQADAASEWADGSGVDIEVRTNVTYHQASGQELKLDLYLPHDRRQARPLVVWIHGGGWVAGSREVANLRLLPWLQMGWAAANVSYRLAKQAPAPAAVEDVRCALRWLYDNAEALKLDRERIVVTGGSAGAHLALLAGMMRSPSRFDNACATPDGKRWRSGEAPPLKVAAIVNLMGITDLAPLVRSDAQGRHYAVEWFGALAEPARSELARELSPLSHVHSQTPPILSFHGDADEVVPFSQATRLHAALAAQRRPERLLPVAGAGHGFNRAQMVEVMVKTREFLREQGIRLEP